MKTAGRPLLLTARSEQLPRWVRVRDALLTLALWVICAWTWLQLFPEVEAWLDASLDDGIDFASPPIVATAQHGLVFAAALVGVFYLWSFVIWLRTDADKALPPPPALEPAREAELAGTSLGELAQWREQESVTLHLGRDGRIERPARVNV